MSVSNKLIIGGGLLLWLVSLVFIALSPIAMSYFTDNETLLAVTYSGSTCLAGCASFIILLGALLALVLNNPFDLNF